MKREDIPNTPAIVEARGKLAIAIGRYRLTCEAIALEKSDAGPLDRTERTEDIDKAVGALEIAVWKAAKEQS